MRARKSDRETGFLREMGERLRGRWEHLGKPPVWEQVDPPRTNKWWYYILAGATDPGTPTLAQLCELLETPPAYLLGHDPDPELAPPVLVALRVARWPVRQQRMLQMMVAAMSPYVDDEAECQ